MLRGLFSEFYGIFLVYTQEEISTELLREPLKKHF